MLSCKEVSLLVSRSCDTKLTWRERLAVRLHLLVCVACRRFTEQMRFLRRASRAFAERQRDAASGGLSTDARDRIRRTLRGQD
jgi:hypothetical protein